MAGSQSRRPSHPPRPSLAASLRRRRLQGQSPTSNPSAVKSRSGGTTRMCPVSDDVCALLGDQGRRRRLCESNCRNESPLCKKLPLPRPGRGSEALQVRSWLSEVTREACGGQNGSCCPKSHCRAGSLFCQGLSREPEPGSTLFRELVRTSRVEHKTEQTAHSRTQVEVPTFFLEWKQFPLF